VQKNEVPQPKKAEIGPAVADDATKKKNKHGSPALFPSWWSAAPFDRRQERRGRVNIKGKGEMEVFYLLPKAT
jgi:hypothetical protein